MGIARATVELDLPAMLKRKDEVVSRPSPASRFLFKKNKIDGRQSAHGDASPRPARPSR